MDPAQEREIVAVLDGAKDMTIATLREDGYPHATTVSYASEGLAIYFGCGRDSQKARNLARNNRVSLTVNLPYANWDEIRGASMGGTAVPIVDPKETQKVLALMLKKFPEVAQYAPEDMTDLVLFRIVPTVVSLLDYRKGFGHAELIEV